MVSSRANIIDLTNGLEPEAPDLAAAGWTPDSDLLTIGKTFRFRRFLDAMAFMQEVALQAEADNHHPQWRNVYNRVEVQLTSHDIGAVSHRDIRLARAMEKVAKSLRTK